jgi:hypothetical protein
MLLKLKYWNVETDDMKTGWIIYKISKKYIIPNNKPNGI